MKIFKNTDINFIGKRKIALYFSLIFIFCGLISLIVKGGPLLSIDFTGGTLAQIKFPDEIVIEKLRDSLIDTKFKNAEIIEFGSPNEILLKVQYLGTNSDFKSNLNSILNQNFEIRRLESVGPKIGKELRSDARNAILIALMLIGIYITFRFDRFYAYGSVVAILHDILITFGIFSLLNIEIDLHIIAAFLTIVGYSLNDTIVVFDRIRENFVKHGRESIETIVNISINSTLSRTVITSLTTFLVVLILYLLGGEVIKNFAFALIIGVLIGTYSSIYVASPVMIYFEKKNVVKNQK